MKLCPYCQIAYGDDMVFCVSDGTRLLDNNRQPEITPNPPVGGDLPPTGFIPPPTLPVGQSNFSGDSETVTLVQPSYTPPIQHQQPAASNTSKNIIIVVLAAISVFLLAAVFIATRDKNSRENNFTIEREDNSEAKSKDEETDDSGESDDEPEVQDSADADEKITNKKTNKTDQVDKPDKSVEILPDGIEQRYSGASYFPNNRLPLTLTLERKGQGFFGTAQTPKDTDDLSGTVQSDGSFSLSGYNRNAGRVTGTWRGRVNENGQVSGVWTSIDGSSKVRFSARQTR